MQRWECDSTSGFAQTDGLTHSIIPFRRTVRDDTYFPSHPPIAKTRPSSRSAIEALPGYFVLYTTQDSLTLEASHFYDRRWDKHLSVCQIYCDSTYSKIITANDVVSGHCQRKTIVQRNSHRHHYTRYDRLTVQRQPDQAGAYPIQHAISHSRAIPSQHLLSTSPFLYWYIPTTLHHHSHSYRVAVIGVDQMYSRVEPRIGA